MTGLTGLIYVYFEKPMKKGTKRKFFNSSKEVTRWCKKNKGRVKIYEASQQVYDEIKAV